MKDNNFPISRSKIRAGFTLVELMVVIAIIAVLAALVFSVSLKVMNKARKVTCVSLSRSWSTALESYYADFNKPPLPSTRDADDTVFGDPGGNYSTAPLVSILTGGPDESWIDNSTGGFDLDSLNPNREVYIEATLSTSKRDGGIMEDGKLYDPWGRELMFAINSRNRVNDDNGGKNDQILNTDGLAEWAEIKPGYQDHVIWSYGADGEHGRGTSKAFAGSDDVKSF